MSRSSTLYLNALQTTLCGFEEHGLSPHSVSSFFFSCDLQKSLRFHHKHSRITGLNCGKKIKIKNCMHETPLLKQTTLLLPHEVHTEPDHMFHHQYERCVVASRKIAQGCAWGHTGAVPSDDAASSPHQSDGAVVEGPAELFGRLSQQHETLRVGNDLGCIKSLQTHMNRAL